MIKSECAINVRESPFFVPYAKWKPGMAHCRGVSVKRNDNEKIQCDYEVVYRKGIQVQVLRRAAPFDRLRASCKREHQGVGGQRA